MDPASAGFTGLSALLGLTRFAGCRLLGDFGLGAYSATANSDASAANTTTLLRASGSAVIAIGIVEASFFSTLFRGEAAPSPCF